jgi:TonB family protein
MALRLEICGCVALAYVLQAQIQPTIPATEIRREQPIYQTGANYPRAAQAARITGVVILDAVIGTDGAVDELKLISGHPLLVNAAFDAVRQWRYRPATRNGRPELATTSIWIAFPSGSNFAPLTQLRAQAQPNEAARGTRLHPIDVGSLAGVWQGAEVNRIGINRTFGWSAAANWTIAFEGGRLTRTERLGAASRSVTVSYELDGSASRSDGSDFPLRFADSPDPTEYKITRRVKTLTRDLVELEEQAAVPAGNTAHSKAYVAIDECWELSASGDRLTAVRNYRVFDGRFVRRYSMTYDFKRVSDGPGR